MNRSQGFLCLPNREMLRGRGVTAGVSPGEVISVSAEMDRGRLRQGREARSRQCLKTVWDDTVRMMQESSGASGGLERSPSLGAGISRHCYGGTVETWALGEGKWKRDSESQTVLAFPDWRLMVWLSGWGIKGGKSEGEGEAHCKRFSSGAGWRPIKGQTQVGGDSASRESLTPAECKCRNTRHWSASLYLCFQFFFLKSMVLRGDP